MRCQPQIYIKKRQIGGVFCHTVVKSTVLRRGKINIYAAKIYNYATEFMEEFMTLGEKLAKLRRENNHTQEQLADILGVSRQSVSKWESDLAYPETDKIIKIGELYNCSLDYLLKENSHKRQAEERGGTQEPQTGSRYTITFDLHSFHFERKSKIMIGKLPLWHINIGFGRTAKGFFAVGLCARGVFSLGVLSLGVFSAGALSLGAVSLGAIVLGLLSLGAISVGVLAFGAIAVGLVAVGALAVGGFSFGALAAGSYLAIGDHAYGAVAIGFTKAAGDVFSAAQITSANRGSVIAALDGAVPAAFAWIKDIVVSIL